MGAYVRRPTTALARTGAICCDRAPVPMNAVCIYCYMELLAYAEAWKKEEEWPTPSLKSKT